MLAAPPTWCGRSTGHGARTSWGRRRRRGVARGRGRHAAGKAAGMAQDACRRGRRRFVPDGGHGRVTLTEWPMPWIERGVPGCTMSCASPPREVIPRRPAQRVRRAARGRPAAPARSPVGPGAPSRWPGTWRRSGRWEEAVAQALKRGAFASPAPATPGGTARSRAGFRCAGTARRRSRRSDGRLPHPSIMCLGDPAELVRVAAHVRVVPLGKLPVRAA